MLESEQWRFRAGAACCHTGERLMERRARHTEDPHPVIGRPARRTRDLECQDVGDELMVMDARSDRVHVLNATMAAIWKLCNGRSSPEQIAQALSEVVDCSQAGDLLAVTRDSLRSLAALELFESFEPPGARGA
jgi:hypothetical protein